MFRKLLFVIMAIATMFSIAGLSSPAHADTQTATVSSLSFDQAHKSISLTAKDYVAADAHGKLYAAYVHNPSKTGHYSVTKALHTPFAANYKAGQNSGKPFRLHKGQKFPTTWKGATAPIYSMVKVKYPWQVFVPESDGLVHNRGYYNQAKHRWFFDCDNPKPPVGVHMTPMSKLHIVQRLHISLTGLLGLAAYVSGQVSVDCGGGNSSSAGYHAHAKGHSKTAITVTGNSFAATKNKLKKAINASVKLRNEAKLSLKEDAVFKLKGAATATCTYTPPTTTPGSPDLQLAPEACVQVGATTGVVDYVADNGDTVAHNGSVSITAKDVLAQNVAIPANGSVSGKFSNLSPGSFNVTLTLDNGKSVTKTVTVEQCQAPQVTKPAIQADLPNDVLVGNSRTLTGQIKGQAGRTIVVHAHACNGGTITDGDKTIVANGTWQQFTFNYVAPSEGTTQNTSPGCETPAGKDRVNYDATDKQDSSLTASTNVQFGITVPNPDPNKTGGRVMM